VNGPSTPYFVVRRLVRAVGSSAGDGGHRLFVKGLLAVLAVLVCGCAGSHPVSVPDLSAPPPTSTQISSRPDPQYQDPNRVKAVAEADRLLAEAVVPAGSTIRVGSPPVALSAPIMGTPGSSHLIDARRVWAVPMAMANFLTWLRSHPPARLTRSGSSSGRGPGGESAGYAWSDSPTRAYGSPELDIGVTPSGTSRSIVRADGIDIWLSATPTVDTGSGRRVRVTIAGGCPATIAGYGDVANPRGDLTARMLPAETPTAGLICRYGRVFGASKASTLAHSTVLSTPPARTLARSVNAIWTGSAGTGSTSCPDDTGVSDVIVFGYTGRSDVDLWYHASGCQGVDNGYIVGVQVGNPSFFDGFQPLLSSLAK
jgi:hypothetical protein